MVAPRSRHNIIAIDEDMTSSLFYIFSSFLLERFLANVEMSAMNDCMIFICFVHQIILFHTEQSVRLQESGQIGLP